MSGPPPPSARFAPQNQNTQERLSTNTVGLVALSDFRKRRAEVLEQQEREAREALNATATPDRSQTGTPANASDASDSERQLLLKKKKQKRARLATATKLSFTPDDGDEDGEDGVAVVVKGKGKGKSIPKPAPGGEEGGAEGAGAGDEEEESSAAAEKRAAAAAKIAANAAVGIVPRALTKAALRREAAEREALRKEFLELQAAVKSAEIAIPFVFYDGANTPGGVVSVKKGDFIWVFLDKSRKVGAQMGVGGGRRLNIRRDWARVGVDDLMLVRGTIIIPHHYEFYFFIVNKTMGPGSRLLFDYSAEAPPPKENSGGGGGSQSPENKKTEPPAGGLRRAGDNVKNAVDISTLEGANDDPNFTKVVDRRWYERNKHIYPASVWQEFEPEKDYRGEVRRDLGGNTFFYSR